MINYDDAISQLRAAGLLLDRDRHGKPLIVGTPQPQRWRVAGMDKEWRGWTALREWTSRHGNTYLVGHYGVWIGNEDNRQRIVLPKPDKDETEEQRQRRREEMAGIIEANKAAARQMEARRRQEILRAAAWAAQVWAHARPVTEHDYLTRKGVKAHGLRLFTGLDGLVFDDLDEDNLRRLQLACQTVGDVQHDALLVPMHDAKGQVNGLQIIYGKGHPRRARLERDKEFWPTGMAMGGTHGLVGPVPRTGVLLIAEGYATAATLHESTGYPVAYAFSANNLAKAGKALRKQSPGVKILFCADDDYLTEGNPGLSAAANATAEIPDSAWVKPDFTDEAGADRRAGKKLTDFNDLLALDQGLPHRLAAQIHARLDALGWRDAAPTRAGGLPTGGGESVPGARASMLAPDEVVERFSPVWSEEDVYYFDHLERVVVKKPSIANRMPRGGFDIVTVHPVWRAKPEVALARVDFDPTDQDPSVVYNLWGGWQYQPDPAPPEGCRNLLRLLRKLCGYEHAKADEVYHWVLRWLAYPIQHPGAKMQSCILMHGTQGAGKNTFFDAMLEIYADHAVEFGPSQLEKRFNALFSKKMFAIGNEVVASREDLYHVKGHIKHMITERRWVVEAKNKDERWERNCCNFVFLSNEINPQALDKGDRRHCVIWTPNVPDKDRQPDEWRDWWENYWGPAKDERRNGGVAALYHYLKGLDLAGFNEATWPPMTQAKQDLIDLNMDSRERFYTAWIAEDLGLPAIPVPRALLYDAYRAWASPNRAGIPRAVAEHSLMAFIGKQPGVSSRRENLTEGQKYVKATVIFPHGITDPADGQSRSAWLTDCRDEFLAALDAYRG